MSVVPDRALPMTNIGRSSGMSPIPSPGAGIMAWDSPESVDSLLTLPEIAEPVYAGLGLLLTIGGRSLGPASWADLPVKSNQHGQGWDRRLPWRACEL